MKTAFFGDVSAYANQDHLTVLYGQIRVLVLQSNIATYKLTVTQWSTGIRFSVPIDQVRPHKTIRVSNT
jgi:hypothetical protein